MKKVMLLWPLTVLIAFYLGYKMAVPSDTSKLVEMSADLYTDTGLSENRVSENKQSSIQDTLTQVTPTEKVVDTSASDSPLEDIVLQARSLMGTNRYFLDFKGVASAYNLVQKLNEEELKRVLLENFSEGGNAQDANILAILISQYAEYNPQGALDFIDANIESPNAKLLSTISAIKAWTNADPERAFGWYQTQKFNAKRQGLMSGVSNSLAIIFDGLAKQDIDLALANLYTLQDGGRDLQMAMLGLANALTEKAQFAELLSETQDMGNKQLRSSILSVWGTQNPTEIGDWLDNEYLGEDKHELRERAMSTWMLSEPLSSAEWFMQNATAENRQASVEKVVEQWSLSSPQGALEWLLSQQEIDFDSALSTLLIESSFSNSDFVMNNLELLEDKEQKEEIAFNLYLSLKHKSEKQAEEFKNNSPYSAYIRKSASYLDDNEEQ